MSLFLAILVIAVAVGCAAPVHRAEPVLPVAPPGVGNVELGNMTYIPLNLNTTLEASIEKVFVAVAMWEKEHPDREVVDIDYLHQQMAYATGAYVYGVIIYSRAKGAK